MACEVTTTVNGEGQICLTHGARTHYPWKPRDPACTLPVLRSQELDRAEQNKANWVNRVLDQASYNMATLVHAPQYRAVVSKLVSGQRQAAERDGYRLADHVNSCKWERAGLFCPWKP